MWAKKWFPTARVVFAFALAAMCIAVTLQTCLALCVRLEDGELVEVPAHEYRIVAPPCEAGAPIEVPRGTHIDAIEARAILVACASSPLPDALNKRLVEIANGPTP